MQTYNFLPTQIFNLIIIKCYLIKVCLLSLFLLLFSFEYLLFGIKVAETQVCCWSVFVVDALERICNFLLIFHFYHKHTYSLMLAKTRRFYTDLELLIWTWERIKIRMCVQDFFLLFHFWGLSLREVKRLNLKTLISIFSWQQPNWDQL